MQIPCISCQSRFRLDKSLVKSTGSLVRCSKCKYIFRVYPPALNDEPVNIETKINNSTTDELSVVELAYREIDSSVKTIEKLNGHLFDEMASIEAFEEEEEDPEIENIDSAELTQLY